MAVGPDLTFNGVADAFVAKVAPSGNSLAYAGYIGGAGEDLGFGVAVDGAGSAYVTGSTTSAADTFPVKIGPDLTLGGYRDAFVAKVTPSGVSLAYAGYIGGDGEDLGQGVAVGPGERAYVTGRTYSSDDSFPVKVGPDLTFNGDADGLVAKVNRSGDSLLYAGYIGGVGYDYGYGVGVDRAGSAYLAGYTNSGEGFPVVVGPDLTYNGGGLDAFVVKVNRPGDSLLYAGYIGGAGGDGGTGVAVDTSGSAYVTGNTGSSADTFPVMVGPDLTHNGGADAFVAKVTPSGESLTYAGYIGGASSDYGYGLAADGAGGAYVTGHTLSSEDTFPVKLGPDLTYNGGFGDAFVAKVEPSGESLAYAGYVGGPALDDGLGVAVDTSGSAYVAGYTKESIPVKVGPDLSYNGGPSDAFLTKISS